MVFRVDVIDGIPVPNELVLLEYEGVEVLETIDVVTVGINTVLRTLNVVLE